MDSQPDSEEKKEFSTRPIRPICQFSPIGTFCPICDQFANWQGRNSEDLAGLSYLANWPIGRRSYRSNRILETILQTIQIVQNEAEAQSFEPVTDQPASVNIKDEQAANEGDGLLNNQKFSSQFCECDGDCCTAWCFPCISIYSTEKELSNENKGIGLILLVI